jgi:hypothetical protein
MRYAFILFLCVSSVINTFSQGIFKYASIGYGHSLTSNNINSFEFRITPINNYEGYYGEYGRTAAGLITGLTYRESNEFSVILAQAGVKTELDIIMFMFNLNGLPKEFNPNLRYLLPLEIEIGGGWESNYKSEVGQIVLSTGFGLVFKEKMVVECIYSHSEVFQKKHFRKLDLAALRLGVLF